MHLSTQLTENDISSKKDMCGDRAHNGHRRRDMIVEGKAV